MQQRNIFVILLAFKVSLLFVFFGKGGDWVTLWFSFLIGWHWKYQWLQGSLTIYMISHKSHTSYLDHMIQHLMMESSSKFLSCDRSSGFFCFVVVLFFSKFIIFFFNSSHRGAQCFTVYALAFFIFWRVVFLVFSFQVIYVTAIDFHISVALVD